jgi:heavy metal sensor kinase
MAPAEAAKGRRGRKPLSIGAKWTLQYAAAIVLSLTAFSVYAYYRMAQHDAEDGRLLLELQATALEARIDEGFADSEELDDYIETLVEAEPYLKIGVQVWDRDRKRLHSRGTLRREYIRIPDQFDDPRRKSHFYEADVSASYPYWILTKRSKNGFVQVGIYSREFVNPTRQLGTLFLTATPIVLTLTFAAGFWLSRISLRPLVEMAETTRRITGSRLDEPIPTTGAGDELDVLAHTLDQMRLRISDSVSKLRHFSADAAHQLRTPLTKLRSRLEVTLETEELEPSVRRALEDNLVEIGQLSDAITAMLQLARSEAGLADDQRAAVDLGHLLDSVVEFYGPMADDAGIQLHTSVPDPATVLGDETWLRQLFANLIENAIRHSSAGGEIEIRVEAGDPVRVHVADAGSGIETSDLQRVFDRFHRSRADADASGIGLGLTIADQIARAHGGEIDVESRVGHGSTFSVSLPPHRE